MQQLQEGQKTDTGLILTRRPSLDSEPEVKFAALTDGRLLDPQLYLLFEPFLPEGFRFVAPPSNQNCFDFCLNTSTEIDRIQFMEILRGRGFACSFDDPDIGDMVGYVRMTPEDGYSHAGKYMGKGLVHSRWGSHNPVIEHPIDQVLPQYKHSQAGYWLIEKPTHQQPP